MKQTDNSIREKLSAAGQKIFDDVAFQRVLGASTHIKLISEMIKDLVEHSQSQNMPVQEIIINIHILTDFFKKIRGEASQAINNAIDLMINGIDELKTQDSNIFLTEINKKIDHFHKQNSENIDQIIQFASELLLSMDSILLFDYSSTVGKMIESSKNTLNIILPESRILNGGKPYVERGLKRGHRIHFIPDAAILYYLKQCDGVFIGSETLYPDGRVFNTIGSEMVAYLCKSLGIPFYVLTTLIKIDMRPLRGYQKPPVIVDLKCMFESIVGEDLSDQLDYSCPELVEIPSQNITGLITEKGIISPTAVFQLATDFFKGKKGL
jgi:ribose 1,5-bisphosphate isomerase